MAAPDTRPMVEAPLKFRLRPGGKRTGRDCFLRCAKCDAPGMIRRSDRPTATTTQLTVHCTDSACGHIWRADVVFVHSMVEGNIDRPDLDLPVCPKSELVHVRPPSGEDEDAQKSMFEPPTD